MEVLVGARKRRHRQLRCTATIEGSVATQQQLGVWQRIKRKAGRGVAVRDCRSRPSRAQIAPPPELNLDQMFNREGNR